MSLSKKEKYYNPDDQRCINVLVRAKEVLQQHNWIKGSVSVDSNGTPCSPEKPEATSFCLTGALHRAINDLEFKDRDDASIVHALASLAIYEAMLKMDFDLPISLYNDGIAETKEDIISIIDNAIEFVEKEGI